MRLVLKENMIIQGRIWLYFCLREKIRFSIWNNRRGGLLSENSRNWTLLLYCDYYFHFSIQRSLQKFDEEGHDRLFEEGIGSINAPFKQTAVISHERL